MLINEHSEFIEMCNICNLQKKKSTFSNNSVLASLLKLLIFLFLMIEKAGQIKVLCKKKTIYQKMNKQ